MNLQTLPVIRDRQRAEDAVGISHREDGDARGAFQRARRTVADGLSGRHVAHLQNASRKLHHGGKSVGGGAGSLAAVKGDPWADEVVVIGAPEQNAGGVGEACCRLRQFGAKGVEGLFLHLVLGVLRLVGASEMTHHQSELEGVPRVLRAGNGLDLGG